MVSYEWDCASDALIFTRNCESILGLDTEKVVSTNQAWEERVHPEDRLAFPRGSGKVEESLRPAGDFVSLRASGR